MINRLSALLSILANALIEAHRKECAGLGRFLRGLSLSSPSPAGNGKYFEKGIYHDGKNGTLL